MLNGALPTFDLAEGGIPLAIARGLAVAALFSAFGTVVFQVWVTPRVLKPGCPEHGAILDRRLRRLVWGSLAIGLAALLGWLLIQTKVMASAGTVGETLAALIPVATGTLFGRVILGQIALAVATVAALGSGRSTFRWRLATGMATLAVLLQAGHSHALAMDGPTSLLLASDALHLLCAGAWLGGLVPLLLSVRALPPRGGAMAARYFSPLGQACLYGLVLSAAYQGWELLGGFPGIVGTAYGWVALVKLALFSILFGFAVANRYWFAPALLDHGDGDAKRRLIASIAVQTGFGVAIVIAAGVLSSLQPGLHEQPVWPFTERPSLITIEEDPDFRREAIEAILALGGAMLLAGAGVNWRRIRWPAIAAAAVTVWFAAPHLSLLLVEAYPTSYDASPTGFAAPSIMAGADLYPANCASCHGSEGRGDGPLATSLPIPPADLTAGHLWGHSDGELFWWLSEGMPAPDGGLVMPGFADRLSDDQRWDLIDFIRARNAGLVHAATGGWSPPVRAPGFTAACAAGARPLEAFRGRVVYLIFQDAAPAKPTPIPTGGDAPVDLVVYHLGPQSASAGGPDCAVDDPAVIGSYALISGRQPAAMAGRGFLIDPDGWLRDEVSDTATPPLSALIDEICSHPISGQGGGHAHHHPA